MSLVDNASLDTTPHLLGAITKRSSQDRYHKGRTFLFTLVPHSQNVLEPLTCEPLSLTTHCVRTS